MRAPLPFIALSALVLVGCTMAPLISSPTPLPPSEARSASPEPTSVDSIGTGEVWTLRDVKAGPLDHAAIRSTIGPATVSLVDTDTATGTAGCRTFTADFDFETAMEVRITELTVDESGCAAPTPGLADFESFVTDKPISAQLAAGLLTLSMHDGTYAFVFENKGAS
jgi:hypothetical protein